MDDQFDEFGNFIGDVQPPVVELPQPSHEVEEEFPDVEQTVPVDTSQPMDVIVLNEDKTYYPSATSVYGDDVEVLVREEDTQTITQPLITPMKIIEPEKIPENKYSYEYIVDKIDQSPNDVRSIAFIGAIHHGKTSLLDLLISHSHDKDEFNSIDTSLTRRFTDNRTDEKNLLISVKSTPFTLCLERSVGQNIIVNIIDTPGHTDFIDEVSVSLQLVDSVVVIVDAAEGVLESTKRLLKLVKKSGLTVVLVLSKIDRLIVDLKLPPSDFYYKLVSVLNDFNHVLEDLNMPTVHPINNTVVFSSTAFNILFTLQSFAKLYTPPKRHHTLEQRLSDSIAFDSSIFASHLWGDWSFDHSKHQFIPCDENSIRTFTEFITQPLYKLTGICLSSEPHDLDKHLKPFHVKLSSYEKSFNSPSLLRRVFHYFFKSTSNVISSIADVFYQLPSYIDRASSLSQNASSPEMQKAITNASSSGPVIAIISRFYKDNQGYYGLCRVLSGTLEQHTQIHVIGENYSSENTEDMSTEMISNIFLIQSNYMINAPNGIARGGICGIRGIDEILNKSGILVDVDIDIGILQHHQLPSPCMKVAIEPLKPSELPIMLNALSIVSKCYPGVQIKCEESGEHIIIGYGEMYMDCVLRDIRENFGQVEIKVSDPMVVFRETVSSTTNVKIQTSSGNGKMWISTIVESLEKDLKFTSQEKVLREKYGWDALMAKSVLSFGSGLNDPNCLINDVLDPIKRRIVQSNSNAFAIGFNWAINAGPLCEEPLRECRVRLIDCDLPTENDPQRIMQMMRKSIYSSILLAEPRLMEPIYSIEILSPEGALSSIRKIVKERRGFIIDQYAIEGTPLHVLNGCIPLIDLFGFETDVRCHTRGQAFVQSAFSNWGIVPGDPLDKQITPLILQPNPQPFLAREFMMKTRRRKGLAEDVFLQKYFDHEIITTLQQQNYLL
ncbi:116 kDa U5 small nuclear ribonucleoprotein component [Entamoeba marina]